MLWNRIPGGGETVNWYFKVVFSFSEKKGGNYAFFACGKNTWDCAGADIKPREIYAWWMLLSCRCGSKLYRRAGGFYGCLCVWLMCLLFFIYYWAWLGLLLRAAPVSVLKELPPSGCIHEDTNAGGGNLLFQGRTGAGPGGRIFRIDVT